MLEDGYTGTTISYSKMKYYIIAGEASGDLHGANLIKALKGEDSNASFSFWGGDKMIKEGNDIRKHIRDTSFMGFVEVIKNIFSIIKLFSFAKKDIIECNPDCVILIDYPGFNLKLAKWLYKQKIKTIYYISPQVWAWKKKRVFLLDKFCDKIITILPFEQDFYKAFGIDVDYVGHPLLDESQIDKTDPTPNENNIAILPGSRLQEIQKMLPTMIEGALLIEDSKVLIGHAPSVDEKVYFAITKSFAPYSKRIAHVKKDTYGLLRKSELAIVASGTATLETAIIGTPQVVCYKGNLISYHIAKKLVKLKYISLVNLIMNKSVVPELIQDQFTTKNIYHELTTIKANSEDIKNAYLELKNKLGGSGASQRAAHLIFNSF